MEGLAPPLICLIEISSSLQNGDSVRTGLQKYLRQHQDEFALLLRRVFFAYEQGQNWRALLRAEKSAYRRELIECLAVGLQGQTLLPRLQELQKELVLACEQELKQHIELLPLKMLMPLLLLLFPAFILLLLGPILSQLLESLSK